MTAISSWKRGDHALVARVTITDSNGPVDLTSNEYVVTWQLRPSANSATMVPVVLDETDADSGVLVGSLTDTTTKTMRAGTWVSDIEVVNSAGKPYSSITFEVEVIADVSRPTEVAP